MAARSILLLLLLLLLLLNKVFHTLYNVSLMPIKPGLICDNCK